MISNSFIVINDIYQCLEHARWLAHRFKNTRKDDRELLRVFVSMAGDETTGLLAYVIWRGRSRLLSSLRLTSKLRYDG